MALNTKNTFSQRLLCGIMAVVLLNCSVDSPDTQQDFLSDKLSINDQESLLEILVEKVFKFENAIAEYDEDDTEGLSMKKAASVDHFILGGSQGYLHVFPDDNCPQGIHVPEAAPCPFAEIHAPPPEAWFLSS